MTAAIEVIVRVIAVVAGSLLALLGVGFLCEASAWDGDHENRVPNFFQGALMFLTGLVIVFAGLRMI